MFGDWSTVRFDFICAMKTILSLVILFGAAQFALANSAVSESLDLGVIDGLVFGSLQGSFGFIGALCFGLAVVLRLKRPGR